MKIIQTLQYTDQAWFSLVPIKKKHSCSFKLKFNVKLIIQTEKAARGIKVSIRLSCQLWGWTGLGPSGPAFSLSPSPVCSAAATVAPPESLRWRPAAGLCRRVYPHPTETGTTFM